MNIVFDVEKHQFEGYQKLVYHNNSPEKLDRLSELSGLRRAEQSRRLHYRLDEARGSATRTDQG